MTDSADASDKLGAVTTYLEKRLGEHAYWECSSDLLRSVDVYVCCPDWEELRIPMDDIQLIDGEIDDSVEQQIEAFLSRLSL